MRERQRWEEATALMDPTGMPCYAAMRWVEGQEEEEEEEEEDYGEGCGCQDGGVLVRF